MEHLGLQLRRVRRTSIDPPQIMFLDSDVVSMTAPLDPYCLDHKKTPYGGPGDAVLQLEEKIDQISIDDASGVYDQSSSVYS